MIQNALNQVVPAQTKPILTNTVVAQYLAMKETQKALKERLALMDDAVHKAESEIIAQVESGADLSKCGRAVSIVKNERRYPAWKEHFIERVGKAAADEVLNSTMPTVHKRLVIA